MRHLSSSSLWRAVRRSSAALRLLVSLTSGAAGVPWCALGCATSCPLVGGDVRGVDGTVLGSAAVPSSPFPSCDARASDLLNYFYLPHYPLSSLPSSNYLHEISFPSFSSAWVSLSCLICPTVKTLNRAMIVVLTLRSCDATSAFTMPIATNSLLTFVPASVAPSALGLSSVSPVGKTLSLVADWGTRTGTSWHELAV